MDEIMIDSVDITCTGAFSYKYNEQYPDTIFFSVIKNEKKMKISINFHV